MQIPLVMTVIGRDRPGLVESVARLVAGHGGNWLQSRMCRLGGEFAGILRIEVDAAREEALRKDLQALQDLHVTICSGGAGSDGAAGKIVALELVGQDRPGIVREISHALARQGINVEELATECTSAPMSGERLFTARANLTVPESCPLPELRKELEQLAGNLMVDISLEELR